MLSQLNTVIPLALRLQYVRAMAPAQVMAMAHLGLPLESTLATQSGIRCWRDIDRSMREPTKMLSAPIDATANRMTAFRNSGRPLIPASFKAMTKGDWAMPEPPKRCSLSGDTSSPMKTMQTRYTTVTRMGIKKAACPTENRGDLASPARNPVKVLSNDSKTRSEQAQP